MSSAASAAPTSIPHHERSSHHHETGELLSPISTARPQSIPSSSSPTSASFSTSPPLVSPLYAGANRAFAAASTSPTSRWSNNNHNPASPSNTTKQSPKLEKEYFDGPWGKNGLNKSSSSSSTSDNPMGHHRRATSGSISSSLSSLGNNSSSGEPTTPKEGISNSLTNGFTPLGRVPSLPLSSNGSYEAAQKRLSGSSASGNTSTWGSLSSSFSRNNTKTGSSPTEKSGMGGLLRSFSISRSNGPSSPPLNNNQVANPISSPTFNHSATGNNGNGNTSPSSGLPALDASVVSQQPTSPVVVVEGRGRKASVGQGGKRRPSPMGERLLMGHFNAH